MSTAAWEDRGADGPRVTVTIPTHNRARWLGGAIRSVLNQTYDDFHLVVSDNASTDETPEVVRSFSDPRLHYVRLPENVGLLENHNQLYRRVATDYWLILPDDDWIHPELLERAVAALDANPAAGMVHTAFDMIDSEDRVVVAHTNWTYGLTQDTLERGHDFIRETMRYSCRVCASTALMRRAALPQGFFKADEFPAIDMGMWLRMALDWDMAFVGENLGAYRIHDSTHSAGLGRTNLKGYDYRLEHFDRLLDIKLRFVERYADRLADTRALRRLAYRGRRWELVSLARAQTLPERRRGPTLQALRRMVRHDPRVLTDAETWRLLGASLIGRKASERLRRKEAR